MLHQDIKDDPSFHSNKHSQDHGGGENSQLDHPHPPTFSTEKHATNNNKGNIIIITFLASILNPFYGLIIVRNSLYITS